MRILLVTVGVIAAGVYLLKLALTRDPIFDSLASHQRREWAEGWTEGPYWPLERERKERA